MKACSSLWVTVFHVVLILRVFMICSCSVNSLYKKVLHMIVSRAHARISEKRPSFLDVFRTAVTVFLNKNQPVNNEAVLKSSRGAEDKMLYKLVLILGRLCESIRSSFKQ